MYSDDAIEFFGDTLRVRYKLSFLHDVVTWYPTPANTTPGVEETKTEQESNTKVYLVGDCYQSGRGVEQDHKEACRRYQLAVNQGDKDAQYKLSTCYFKGEGVDQDQKEGLRLLLLSVEEGNADAQNMLSECYFKGEGVDQDQKEGLRLLRLSAEQGNADAQHKLIAICDVCCILWINCCCQTDT